jgi:propionyl-CoA carboxylase alpha chain
MYESILIANRGEIAVRIMRTCKRLGIRTVAVYSEADSRGLFRQIADQAVLIGGAQARDSYLDGEKVVAAAISTRCQAVHPGYGFLSENPYFARSVAAAGLVFIGPSATAIAMMGDKIAAKELAVKAGVPVIPGHGDVLKDEIEALAVADSIGYPVLLKPAAGGGGKGMRIVRIPEEMKDALAASRQEASRSFNDARIFMERYIDNPRHIEVQVVADAHGNVVHLGERECSIQRRYQKIIEESPSPGVSDDLRQRMGMAACQLARKAGYVNVGTVEFVLDGKGQFYFLEMNTRLQVEHPVTEMVTGLDLVELQLRIACGEPLPFRQDQVALNGWAMEARICAEDPTNAFMPSTGMITRYSEPRGTNVRVDSGFGTGGNISPYYDSMLAKVICHGGNREDARKALIESLNGYHVEGVLTNIDFVSSVLCHPEFQKGNLSTDFIVEHFQGSLPRFPPNERHLRHMALAAAFIYHVRKEAVRESLRPAVSPIGGRRIDPGTHSYKVKAEKDLFDIRLEGDSASRLWTTQVNGDMQTLESPELEFYRRRLKLKIDNQVHRFRLRIEHSFVVVSFSGITRLFEIYNPREWAAMRFMPERTERRAENVLVCPMPGLVVAVLVKKGDRVFKGQNLVIVESMKMETGVASPMDGIVADVQVKAGQPVESDQELLQFER